MTSRSPMEPRVSLITLGVTDLERAARFYRDGLGWPVSSVGGGEVAFFRTSGAIIALYPREELAADAGVQADAGVPAQGSGFTGIALAHNVRERDQVDAVLRHVREIGGTVMKEAEDAFWGGRSGYFTDPDGFLWEVAWNPGFPIREDGSVEVPE